MKANVISTIGALLGSTAATASAATTGTGADESGLLIWALIGFAVLVVLLQAIPATVMLYAMLKGVFAPADKTVSLPSA